MSLPFAGFCGPSYQLVNKYAAIERCVNFYLEPNQSREEKKFEFQLCPHPGNNMFSPLPVPAPFNQPCRGLLEYRESLYGVNGNVVYRMRSDGSYQWIGGPIPDDRTPVSMAGNGNGQIGIASGGQLYVIDVVSNKLINVPTNPDGSGFQGASIITFQDGYLIAIKPESNQFQISGTDAVPLGDMTQWDAANVAVMAGQTDLLAAAISTREYLRFLGDRRSQIYYDAGSNGIGGFPFQSYNETFIETGILAPFSLVDMNDSLMWIGRDKRGMTGCWRDFAFQPQQVSTFAIEQQWAQYPRMDQARAYAYRWNGHLIYRVTFPQADKTWEYDATVSELTKQHVWYERNFTDAQGVQHARPEQFHAFAFNLHLVGSTGIDGNPGAIYQLQDSVRTDCGVDVNGNQVNLEIVRDRICPHIWQGNKRVVYNRLEFELARGVGLDGNDQPGKHPKLLLRWSNDAGNTWGPEHQVPVGEIGEYGLRAHYDRLGYGRDRVFWVRCSDPVYWGIVAAGLDMIVCAS